MNLMKLYGTKICPDCVSAFEVLSHKGVVYEFIDIMETTANLKEFLKLRDNRVEFVDVIKDGLIGIPCYCFSDDVIFFDTDEAIKKSAVIQHSSRLLPY